MKAELYKNLTLLDNDAKLKFQYKSWTHRRAFESLLNRKGKSDLLAKVQDGSVLPFHAVRRMEPKLSTLFPGLKNHNDDFLDKVLMRQARRTGSLEKLKDHFTYPYRASMKSTTF